MNPLQRMLLAFVAALLKGQNPPTCKLAEIANPSQQWSFASNLTCDADTLRGDKSDVIDAVADGVICTFTYSCPVDPSGPHRHTEMKCKNGKWEGAMPDCSSNDRIFEDILRTFGDQNEEEKEETNEERKDESVLGSAIRKSSSKSQTRQKLRNICKTKQLCYRVDRASSCTKLRVKNGERYFSRINEMFQYLCRYCHKYVCSRGVHLL